MVTLTMKDEWKFVFRVCGELSAVQAGILLMPMLHASKSTWAAQEKVSEQKSSI